MSACDTPPFERRLCRRNPASGEASEGAVEAPTDSHGGRLRKGGEAPLRDQAGFTLLEVLVALAILGLAVVTLLELSSQSLRLVKTSGDYQQAVLLADRLATETQPSDEAVDGGEEGPFQWERRISSVPLPEELQPKETIPGREPAKLFAVTIDVRWGRNQALELATLRTPTTTPNVPGSQPSTAPGLQQPLSPGTGQPITPGSRQPGRSPFPGMTGR